MKTIVITGAGTGIGRATAQLLSEDANNRLILVSRSEENLIVTLNTLQHQENHIIAPLDCRDSSAWKNFYKTMSHDFSIEAVFANAGVGGENHYGENDRWEEVISINLTGTYVTIMEALPFIRNSKNDFRHIVITSSCLGRFGVPNYTAYCTAKTGLLGLTRSLAVELGSEHILVNAICPGWVETEMAKAGIQMLADKIGTPYQETFDDQMNIVPLQRISQPKEIGEMVKFLMSDLQTSITGQGIDINNGSFMI
ncbi:MAG: SDR family oxidoreductase [Flavobacteriales bacterium]